MLWHRQLDAYPDTAPRVMYPGLTVLATYGSQYSGIVFFLFSIPLLRGRWRPSQARRDEQEHEAMVQAEPARPRA